MMITPDATPLANVAIPTLFPHWILGFAALLPVVCMEAHIARRWLPLPHRTLFLACGRANLVSTFAGIPIAYALSIFAAFPITFAAKYAVGADNALEDLLFSALMSGGRIYAPPAEISWPASLILLIPYYYASVYIERRSLQAQLPAMDPARVRVAAIAMNRVSYGLLFVVFFAIYFLRPRIS